MAEKQLSQVTIKHTGGDTTAHFAADIDDFMVYTDDKGTAHSVKKLVFGDTPPTDFVTKGNMWAQLKTQADRCQQTLDNNKSFWNGLSNENYQDPSEDGDAGSSYLATGDDINNLKFYGNDYFIGSDSKDKLVSLGALEDFAKRIPTLGGLNHSPNPGSIAVGTYSGGMPSGATEDSIAWNGLAQGAKSTAIHGMAYGNKGVAIHGTAGGNNSIAIGPNVYISADNGVGIGSNLNVDKSAVVLGQYNESFGSDVRFAVGTGTQQQAKTGLKLTASNAYATSAPRPTLYTDAFNAHGEWVATCDQTSGVLTQSSGMNSIIIEQPLERWTKVLICLNGVREVDETEQILATQSIIIMPKDIYSPSKGIIWHSNWVNSNSSSTSTINVTSVSYDNLTKEIKITLSVSVGQMTHLYYTCEFTGMAM